MKDYSIPPRIVRVLSSGPPRQIHSCTLFLLKVHLIQSIHSRPIFNLHFPVEQADSRTLEVEVPTITIIVSCQSF